ncbi:MAG: FkbM family methyltransferase [Candidatus Pacebacteria bacterium]|nr:FkbM family methyltransferase [Candidatus Paceibacterota bacterium]
MNNTLAKIKARLPGGIYFNQLCSAVFDLLRGKFTLGDKYVFRSYFMGYRYAKNFLVNGFNILEQNYSQNDYLNFQGIKLPKFIFESEKIIFIVEFLDFIYPYLFNNFASIGEGPYLYKDVQIKKGDVVIDAGANFGLFSALASSLGATVYAFEPVKSTREKYLEKTAQLNENINIIPLALSNTIDNILIKGESNVSASIVEDVNQKQGDLINEIVSTITLDDWVKQNNISKIDFIKADIEGAERLMLEGAQWVLKNYAPKLAICTYHLPDDKKVLTDLILKANPDYKIIHKWRKLYAYVDK